MSNNHDEPHTESLAETENYLVWKAEEPDGETTYHVELNNVTVHFFQEEWEEFLELARILSVSVFAIRRTTIRLETT
jgi:hypothetical protein